MALPKNARAGRRTSLARKCTNIFFFFFFICFFPNNCECVRIALLIAWTSRKVFFGRDYAQCNRDLLSDDVASAFHHSGILAPFQGVIRSRKCNNVAAMRKLVSSLLQSGCLRIFFPELAFLPIGKIPKEIGLTAKAKNLLRKTFPSRFLRFSVAENVPRNTMPNPEFKIPR